VTRLVSGVARRRKLEYFLNQVPKNADILEIGCADGWVGDYALANGWHRFTGIDIEAPAKPPAHAFILGDVNRWRDHGLRPDSFDAILAFEVIEHGDFYGAIMSLLRPGGLLMVTTPVPHMDWACTVFEAAHLTQPRTSPHDHLIYLRDLPKGLQPVEIKVQAGISQWGVFRNTSTV
jgi:2-polyprenyl-3-methyl-5-hydroxy-6-metoxy-1,4-benzoquinol methylase